MTKFNPGDVVNIDDYLNYLKFGREPVITGNIAVVSAYVGDGRYEVTWKGTILIGAKESMMCFAYHALFEEEND